MSFNHSEQQPGEIQGDQSKTTGPSTGIDGGFNHGDQTPACGQGSPVSPKEGKSIDPRFNPCSDAINPK